MFRFAQHDKDRLGRFIPSTQFASYNLIDVLELRIGIGADVSHSLGKSSLEFFVLQLRKIDFHVQRRTFDTRTSG